MVVENMDHDKVLVRMDGSRRLTTRNRRFVKKIGANDKVPTARVDTEGMGDHPNDQSDVQQQGILLQI